MFNSFYFTSVTMATIGYGDVAPLTYGGKVTAIIYGFMGAPLFIGLT
ncbi:potassium channel family protein [Patescibacteria group bacterium]|nr:potassium channel family protein [Patescibacteria group bacterium]MBU1758243.1 potassium channel family protein [Patescibacteria group bacterium]